MTTRAQFLKGALAATGLSFLAQATGSGASARGRPNILLIMVDDLPLPAVRRLEKILARVRDLGMNFPNTFAVSPVCAPDRASLLTGLYVHNHGIYENAGAGPDMISKGLHRDSIATRVREQGYATGMFGKFQNNHPSRSVPRGWDRFVVLAEPHNNNEYIAAAVDGEPIRVDRGRHNETAWLCERAKEFVRQRREKPWFCYVAPHSPHLPSDATAENTRRAEEVPLYPSPARSERDLSDKPKWIRDRDSYDGTLREAYTGILAESLDVDDLVDEMVDLLVETEQLQDTFIIFTNDNGYAFGEHGLEAKNHPYDEATKLPLFVRGPGVKAGTSSGRLVSLVDVTATVVDLAGGSWRDLDGRSLVPLLSGEKVPWRSRLLVENFMHRTWRIVRDERYVYIRDGKGDFEQLYDMVEDPYQKRSISSEGRAERILKARRSQLEALRDARGSRLREAEE